MCRTTTRLAVVLLVFPFVSNPATVLAADRKTQNLILVTLDGARTQEIFGGADLEILKDKTKKGSVEDSEPTAAN